MSQQNVELALESNDVFNRRDWDVLLALVDHEVEIESRLVAVEGGYHGHEGLRRWWNDFLGAFPDYTRDIEELRDLGEVTLGHIRGWGHAADSATPLVDPSWNPVRWRDGKIVWCGTVRPRPKPSKPWGRGSRRWRRTTWRSFAACCGPSTTAM